MTMLLAAIMLDIASATSRQTGCLFTIKEKDILVLTLVRTGTHSDLFG